ncbi:MULTISPECIES: polysaccharide biosynthesis/export family protein [Hydrogenophaga]|uniref:Polysaccharide export protein n=1 Tax=Hydrogenophaga intermedia TaxID=65786 RepID=A0A1L1PXB1_HYDIT|nr:MULTISPECIES: polysaccharide biosynthesis/export family protein [Hydrogenophaga]TMU73022.1 polysaccharide export protein [Hydrogenophaga intermedia]CDN89955.1 Polysaccharide export protein [Hydrogenophaga intermedia]
MNTTPILKALPCALGLLVLVAALPLRAQTTAPANAVATPTAAAPSATAPIGAAPGTEGAVVVPGAPPAANADYRLSPNDLLSFDVFGVPDMKRDVRVDASGQLSLPLIGAVQVAGLTAQAAEDLIAARYEEKYLMDPQVSLFIKEFTTQRIAIEGAVTRPGIYPVTGQLTLLRALALSGGFAPYADVKQIVVYRHGANGAREQFTYDLDQVRAGQQKDPDIRADDVIVVQRNARRTALRDSLFSDILSTLNPFN